jgi:DNA-binding NarL/FixJ family response regulator
MVYSPGTIQPRPLRVLIADRLAGSADSLSALLSEYGDFEVVGYAGTAIESVTLIEKLRPDAVLLDMEMPGELFSYVLNLIKRDLQPTAVIVLIPYASCVLRERSLEAGADHVCERTGDPERLIRALLQLAAASQSPV